MITKGLLDQARDHLRFRVAVSDDGAAVLVDDAVAFLDEDIDPSDQVALTAAVADIADEEISAHRAAQASWPKITDCDRLDAAFRYLDAAGIVARQDFSCCNSCGAAEIGGEVEPDQTDVRGYAYYHRQDTERAVEEGQLLVSYGAFYGGADTRADPAQMAAVGREVTETLRGHGLQVTWDGDIDRRIMVTLTWQRRRR